MFDGDEKKFDSIVKKLTDVVETIKFVAGLCGILPTGK